MRLRLVITEGTLKGEEIIIRDAITIGRKGTDLNLQDPKASSQHARIFSDEGDIISVEDLDSSNGTYVNGVKVKISPLKVGDRLTIGKTTMVVEDPPAQKGLEKGTWQEVIEDSFNEMLQKVGRTSAQNSACEPFKEPVRLEFEKGLQAGTSVTFGFGPRSIGKICNDALLFDSNAPDIAFELHPIKDGLCELRTQHSDLLLNGKKFEKPKNKKVKIKNGDRISVGQTVIVVKAFEKL